MWNWLQKTEPVPVTLHTQFVIAGKEYTLISSSTMVQVMRNSTHELLYTDERLGHRDRTQRNVERLYNTMRAVYMCDPPPHPDAQPTTLSDRMARIPYTFNVTYRTNTEDRDEERLEVYISIRTYQMHKYLPDDGVYIGSGVELYVRDPSRRKYTPITLDATGYALSLSRKEATVPGWTFKNATSDNSHTKDLNTILDKLYFSYISECKSQLIDNNQTLSIKIKIYEYQAVLLFTKNPPTLTAACAQRLLEGIERVLSGRDRTGTTG
jgi:hypothetical protein